MCEYTLKEFPFVPTKHFKSLVKKKDIDNWILDRLSCVLAPPKDIITDEIVKLSNSIDALNNILHKAIHHPKKLDQAQGICGNYNNHFSKLKRYANPVDTLEIRQLWPYASLNSCGHPFGAFPISGSEGYWLHESKRTLWKGKELQRRISLLKFMITFMMKAKEELIKKEEYLERMEKKK